MHKELINVGLNPTQIGHVDRVSTAISFGKVIGKVWDLWDKFYLILFFVVLVRRS